MKKLSKLAFVAFACVLVISAVAVLSPRSVHAVIATLVKDVDNPARHAFTTSCSFASTGFSATCTTPAIPTGEEVVIETVGISAFADPSNTKIVVTISTTVNSVTSHWSFSAADNGKSQPVQSNFAENPQLRLYADPGTTIQFDVGTKGTNSTPGGSDLEGTASISGYWVSLP